MARDQLNRDQLKKLVAFAGLALGGYAMYRIFTKNESVEKAVSEAIDKPVKIVKNILKKGSSEAKSAMAKVRSARTSKGGRKKGSHSKKKNSSSQSKGGKATAKLGIHKGHKTKRGLSQDQKRVSKEEWEKSYQKKKKIPLKVK